MVNLIPRDSLDSILFYSSDTVLLNSAVTLLSGYTEDFYKKLNLLTYL